MTQELRKLAEAATQGEWAFGSFHRLLVVPVRDGVPEKHDHIADFGETEIPWDKTSASAQRYNDAAYIAAANPTAILALLDRLEKAEKDAARLDWVIRNRDMRVQGDDHRGWHVLDCSDGLTFVVREEGSFRSAIDSAMEASK